MLWIKQYYVHVGVNSFGSSFFYSPHIIWKRLVQYKDRKDVKFIILTREERFDIYGQHADIFVPLRINGDNKKYLQNCFRIDNYQYYNEYIDIFKKKYDYRYEILEMVVPNTTKAHFSRRDQYDRRRMIYDYRPRLENSVAINEFISNSKKNIVLAPRYRIGMKRNWQYWNDFYDLIYKSKLMNKYNFIICGNDPDYIKDDKNRFYDINSINNQYTTRAGLLIEVMKRSTLTVGSQSAIPNISLLFGVEALEWGHEKIPHTKTYNIMKTKVTFIENHTYDISPKIVFNKMLKILGE